MGAGSENEDDANRFESSSVTFRKNLLRWYDAEKRSYLGENGEAWPQSLNILVVIKKKKKN